MMGISENKFYVVWEGNNTGIFDSRDKCKKNVNGFPNAKYKSFSCKKDAEIALQEGREKYYKIKNNLKRISIMNDENIPYFSKSIAVDAACSGNPGEMEYRGIELKTGTEIFHKKFKIGTNNIGEFLAIVHGLKYLGDDNRIIYSDSKIAISRVNQGKCKTLLNSEKSEKKVNYDFSEIFMVIKSAEEWIKKNGVKHKILKWDTEKRGEIPADFGRK